MNFFSVLSGKDNQHHILRTEVSYYAHTNKTQRLNNKELFKVNGLTFEELLENMTILLDEDHSCAASPLSSLPTNDNVLKVLVSSTTTSIQQGVLETSINDLVAIVWQTKEVIFEWHLGYVKKKVNGKFIIDHLLRSIKNSNTKWKYLTREDIQIVEPDQIIQCDVSGEWDLTSSRKRCYTLANL